MDDSEKVSVDISRTVETPSDQIIKRKDGAVIKISRGKRGRFAKTQKAMPDSREFTRVMRVLLSSMEVGPDGKLSKGSKTVFRRIADNLVNIALTSPSTPVFDKLGNLVTDENGNPVMINDAKMAMASVKAADWLTTRAIGKPSASDEDRAATQTNPIQMVMMSFPELMNKTVVEDKPKPALKPAFAEVTEVTTNPKE